MLCHPEQTSKPDSDACIRKVLQRRLERKKTQAACAVRAGRGEERESLCETNSQRKKERAREQESVTGWWVWIEESDG